MGRLAAILFFVIGTSLAGSFMIAGLVMGYDTTRPIIIAVTLGFLLAIPVSIMVAKAIVNRG
ncbi:CTP synthetase [Salibaculum griseiflavum]|uniref:CTP synthetase n=1 Tax=Salibaculum griseiflavum TaxID=1914409 RepID=A0A2V1P000_9RHOB|nr:CTP synthetase [Salibaculum griseiflavum]PWG15893.1 CTP synthetase [Salibaculum griseiflavum]